MSLVISMTIYVCVVLSTNKRDKPDCLVVFVTELNWPVLNICTPSSFYTFENKMFGFVLPWTLSLAVRWACSNHSPILCRELDKAYFCHSESEERVLREPLFNQPPVPSAQNQQSTGWLNTTCTWMHCVSGNVHLTGLSAPLQTIAVLCWGVKPSVAVSRVIRRWVMPFLDTLEALRREIF